MENCVRTNPYDSSWTDCHPRSSRLEILANAFDAASNRPPRRLILDLIIIFAPVLAVVVTAGALVMVG
jgi:hypothetical protein